MLLRRFGVLFALALAFAASQSDALPRRVLVPLLSQCGAALQLNGGFCPPIVLNFTQNVGKLQGTGIQPASSLITVTRASPHTCSDTSGNWYSVGNNVGCITNQGLLVEEARTNQVRNSSGNGSTAGVIGSGGALPTDWSSSNSSGGQGGLTYTVGAATTVDGLQAIPITMSGTTNTNVFIVVFDTARFNATQNQVFTFSFFSQLTAGSGANITNVKFNVDEYNSGGTFLNAYTHALSFPTSTFASQQASFVIQNATTATAYVYIFFNTTSGDAINFTANWAAPQVELVSSAATAAEAMASSPIITTGSTVTRAADVCTLPSSLVGTFGSAYTLYASGVPLAPTTYTATQALAEIDDNSGNGNNRIVAYRNSGNADAIFQSASGGVPTALTFGAASQSALMKLAGSTAAGSQIAVFNGGVPQTGSGSLPVGVNTVRIGSRYDGTVQFNGYIAKIAIDPTHAYPAGTLTTITSGPGSFIFERDVPANDNFPAWFQQKAA